MYSVGSVICGLVPYLYLGNMVKGLVEHNTSQSCELLECSRQNLSYLIKQGQLQPIREEVKGSLFRKGDILRKKQD